VSIQTINLTASAVEYTFPLTIIESTGKDISGDVIQLSLGSSFAAGTWLSPDVDVAQSVNSQRVVQLLVGAGFVPATGIYWLWSKVADTPETVTRRHNKVIVV